MLFLPKGLVSNTFNFTVHKMYPRDLMFITIPPSHHASALAPLPLFVLLNIGRVFKSGFSGHLVSDNRKSCENSYFSNSLKVKRVRKLQWISY